MGSSRSFITDEQNYPRLSDFANHEDSRNLTKFELNLKWTKLIISSHLEDLPARLLVGDAHGDLPSEAAARPQRRVDRLQPARRPDHEHALTAAGGVCAALLASALSETRGVEFVDRT